MLPANILHTLLDQGQSAPLCFRTPPASRIDLRYWLRADVVPCSTFKRSDLTPRSLQGTRPVARCVSGEGRLRVDLRRSPRVGTVPIWGLAQVPPAHFDIPSSTNCRHRIFLSAVLSEPGPLGFTTD
jgi:hypothetical protein